MMSRIDIISRTWQTVEEHAKTRLTTLREQLEGEGFDHSPTLDAARRARIAELLDLLDLPNPERRG